MVIVHNFYILESDGTGLAYYVYSGPSAKTNIAKRFTNLEAAKTFLKTL
jgi:hypothetical protein